jgi:hypothetical protein
LDSAEIFRALERKRKYSVKNSDFYHIRNTKTFQVWTTTPSQKDQVLLLKWRNCKSDSMLYRKKISQPMREEGV